MHTGAKSDRIVGFYTGGTDDKGRTLAQILAWGDDALESTHDYIQWVFPLPETSGVNPAAPVVTAETVAAFQARPELQKRMRDALARMLGFYGLRAAAGADGAARILVDETRFPARAPLWLRVHNHNHLRLTRIMRSLAVLGLAGEARALQRCLLEDVYDGPGSNRITRETYEFWLAAVRP